MDIKNLIIGILIAALGLTAIDATGIADLIPNFGITNYNYLNPKSNLDPNEGLEIEDSAPIKKEIDNFHVKFLECFGKDSSGKPIPGFNQEAKGVFISFSSIANILKSNPLNLKSNLTPDGIVCFPYADKNGLNIYVTVDNAGFDTNTQNPDFEPFPGSASLTKKPKGVTGTKPFCPNVCGL
jgi:hypothetical protein